ncbi:unnamed protein product [Gadus morhua 'NCC']
MHRSGRLRLRPWLEEQIESGKYPGVTWLDQSAQIFQIPWRHAARHGWSIDQDATLFRSWAMHTGRYRLGRDKPDPKTWKANFRCALNSLTDVCELQDRSRKRGHLASRVYRMLPPTTPQTTPPRTRMHNTGTQLPVGYRTGRTFVAARSTNETQAVQPTPASPSSSTNPNPAERNTSALELWGGRSDQQEQTEAVFKWLTLLDALCVSPADGPFSTALNSGTKQESRTGGELTHRETTGTVTVRTFSKPTTQISIHAGLNPATLLDKQHCDNAVGTDWVHTTIRSVSSIHCLTLTDWINVL